MDPLTILAAAATAYVLLNKKKEDTRGPGNAISPELWNRIQKTIAKENDVGKLQKLEAELSSYDPRTEAIAYALTILRAKIDGLKAKHGDTPHGDTPHGDTPHGDTPHGDTPHGDPPRPNELTPELGGLLARAIQGLGLDVENGKFVGTPTEAGIQAATSVAGQLEKAGYTAYANTLRNYIVLAYGYLPKRDPIVPKPDSVPDDIWERINTAIRTERDPARLRNVLAEMQVYRPESPQMTTAIGVLKQLIAQIESSQVITETVTKIDEVIPKPDTPPDGTPILPDSGTPTEKTKAQRIAEGLVANLKSVQSKFGMPGAKGREDKVLAKAYQAAEGVTGGGLDGKIGPGSMLKIASYVSDLPLVMYWPTSATKKNVLKYRADLLALADQASGSRASELRASAAREHGQAGVVGGPVA
jgi:hypothetical protein